MLIHVQTRGVSPVFLALPKPYLCAFVGSSQVPCWWKPWCVVAGGKTTCPSYAPFVWRCTCKGLQGDEEGGGGDEFFVCFWDLLHLLVWVDVRQIWFGERWDEEEEDDDDDDDDVDDGNAVDIDVSVVDIGVVEIIHAGLMMGMLSSLVCSCSRFGLNSGHHKEILFSWAYPWCGTTITNQQKQ